MDLYSFDCGSEVKDETLSHSIRLVTNRFDYFYTIIYIRFRKRACVYVALSVCVYVWGCV